MTREVKTTNIQGAGDYLDRVYKLIPAELTAGYTAGQSFLGVPENITENIPLLIGFAAFLTAITPFYLVRLQGLSWKKDAAQLCVSTISLPIWAANISALYIGATMSDLWVKALGLILISWVLLAPLFIRKPAV